MAQKVAAVRVGHALDPSSEIGPVATQAQLAKDLAYVELGRQEGAALLCGVLAVLCLQLVMLSLASAALPDTLARPMVWKARWTSGKRSR